MAGKKQRARPPAEAKSNPTLVPATVEQLAEIRALQNNAQRLGRMINRPYSMLLTILTVPSMIYWLFISESSPFSDMSFDLFYSPTLQHPVLEKKRQEMIALENYIRSFTQGIEEMQAIIIENRQYYPLPLSDEMVLDSTDFFLQEGKLKSLLIEHYEAVLKDAVVKYDTKYNLMRTRSVVSLDDLRNNYRASGVFDLVKYETNFLEEYYKNLLYSMKKEFTFSIAYHVFKSVNATYYLLFSLTYAAQIILSMAIQYLAMDKLFNYFFTYGATPLAATTEFLTEQDAKEYLVKEKQRQQKTLQPMADRNVAMAHYFSSIAVPLAALYFWNYRGGLDSRIVVVILSALAMAATNFWETQQIKRKQKLLRSAFDYQRSLLQQNDAKLTIQDNLGADLNSSYFVMKFHNFQRKDVHFSAVKMAIMFKNICAYFAIPIESRREDSVSLLASTMTTQQSNDVRDLFSKTIDQACLNQRFIQYIKKLLFTRHYDEKNLMILPGYQADTHLPTVSVRFLLPKVAGIELEARIKKLFHVEVNDFSDAHYEIIATGLNRFDEKEFEQLSREISQKLNPETKAEEPLPLPAADPSPRYRPSAAPSQSAADEKKPIPSTVPQRVVKWGNQFQYNTESKENNVYPLLLYGQVRSQRNDAKAKFFVTSVIDWKKIPEKGLPVSLSDLKEAVDRIVQHPQFVGDFGAEGWKFCRGEMNDQNRKKFQIASKGKFLGALRNFGVFAERVESTYDSNGSKSALLVVKGISFNRHGMGL